MIKVQVADAVQDTEQSRKGGSLGFNPEEPFTIIYTQDGTLVPVLKGKCG
jgi:hypothetical protein